MWITLYWIYSFYVKSLLGYRNLFFPNDSEKNDKILLNFFQWNPKKLKCIAMFKVNVESFRRLKHCTFSKKCLSVVCSNGGHEYKEDLKKKYKLKY